MAILVVAAHDNKAVRANVANAVAAATQIGSDVHVLVAGQNAGDAAKSAAALQGVRVRALAALPAARIVVRPTRTLDSARGALRLPTLAASTRALCCNRLRASIARMARRQTDNRRVP